MSKEVVDRPVRKIYESESTGEVQIADDVVATIAGLAATEVEGVYAMYGNLTNEIVGKLGVKNLSKGVKVVVEEGEVFAELAITVDFGVDVVEVAKTVQSKVKVAIENMTGLEVMGVNVRIAGVNIDNK
ncbi:MAG: Asp23/Gls24 family envelope stress response protein [Lachnospiraceae bacterium]|nr:Asp23/Gls24 family envelope stress response protein [Lachnospiraceae bacterium]